MWLSISLRLKLSLRLRSNLKMMMRRHRLGHRNRWKTRTMGYYRISLTFLLIQDIRMIRIRLISLSQLKKMHILLWLWRICRSWNLLLRLLFLHLLLILYYLGLNHLTFVNLIIDMAITQLVKNKPTIFLLSLLSMYSSTKIIGMGSLSFFMIKCTVFI